MLRELTPAAFDHLASLGDRLTCGLRTALSACPVPASAHNNGSAFAIHFRAEPPRDYRSSLDADKALCGGDRRCSWPCSNGVSSWVTPWGCARSPSRPRRR